MSDLYRRLYSAQYTVYSVQCTLYIVHRAVCNVHCILYTVTCTYKMLKYLYMQICKPKFLPGSVEVMLYSNFTQKILNCTMSTKGTLFNSITTLLPN